MMIDDSADDDRVDCMMFRSAGVMLMMLMCSHDGADDDACI